MSIIHICATLSIGFMLMVQTSPAIAQDGKEITAKNCASCHDFIGPAPVSLQGVLDRKAPDLFYAGSKFNRPWLVEWLQKPTIMRRSGVMYLNNIINVDGKDQIREGSITPCASNLSLDEAELVATYLMTLTDPVMAVGVVDLGKTIKERKAFRLFSKQLPCIGCHKINIGKRQLGGISGPDLMKAGARLNPDWIYARIENPQYWDPMTWMPRIEMSDRKRQALALYLSLKK